VRAALLALAACSPAAREPASPASPASPDATLVAPAPALTCETSPDWRPGQSFLQSTTVVHVRVASATPGPTTQQSRCVALELDVLDVFRGDVAPAAGEPPPIMINDRVSVVVRQSMIERYTSRPAGAWWIVEQSLEPGSDYIATCPTGKLADALRGSCVVSVAKPHLADLALVRDAETKQLGLGAVVSSLRANCATADIVAPRYLWEKFGEQAVKDFAVYEALISVVLESTCTHTARVVLFDSLYSVGVLHESPPHVRRLVRVMFELLAMPEAAGLHDNLIGTWIPNALGIEGGMAKRTAAEVFAGDAAGRAVAIKTLAAYQGSVDTAKLRAWVK
jgi:hypothetical protein